MGTMHFCNDLREHLTSRRRRKRLRLQEPLDGLVRIDREAPVGLVGQSAAMVAAALCCIPSSPAHDQDRAAMTERSRGLVWSKHAKR